MRIVIPLERSFRGAAFLRMLAAATMVATTAGAVERIETLRGEVVGVDAPGGVLTVRVIDPLSRAARDVPIAIDPETKVIKDGARRALDSVHSGDGVVVNYHDRHGSLVAVSVGVQPARKTGRS